MLGGILAHGNNSDKLSDMACVSVNGIKKADKLNTYCGANSQRSDSS